MRLVQIIGQPLILVKFLAGLSRIVDSAEIMTSSSTGKISIEDRRVNVDGASGSAEEIAKVVRLGCVSVSQCNAKV